MRPRAGATCVRSTTTWPVPVAFLWALPAGWLWKGSDMSQNEAIEARVLDALDETETVRLLADLVRVPSVTGTDAESDLQHRCARLLVEAGLDVDVWKLDLD